MFVTLLLGPICDETSWIQTFITLRIALRTVASLVIEAGVLRHTNAPNVVLKILFVIAHTKANSSS